jgi:ligand-binding sensor domain-containing protein
MNKIVIFLIISILVFTGCEKEVTIAEWEIKLQSLIKTYPIGDIMSISEFKNNIHASGRDGVFRLNNDVFEEILLELNLSYVRKILGDNYLWISSDNGLFIYDGENVKTFTTETSKILDDNTNYIYKDDQERFWVGTWGGAVIFDKELNIIGNQTMDNGLLVENVSIIHQTHDSKMWLGSYAVRSGGISYGSIDDWNHFSLEDGLSHENITSIISTDEKLYIGSGLLDRGGLDILEFKEGEWVYTETIDYESGLLAGQKVRSLFLDDKYLWVGSEYDGISVINLDNFRSIKIKESLPHPEIKVIYYQNGSMWFGTLDGIAYLNEAALDLVYQQIQ